MVRGIFDPLVASKLRLGLAGLVVVGGVLGGGFAAGVFGAPSVADVSNHFGDTSAETTTIHTDLVVNNPNPIGVNLGDVTVTYAVDLNDVRIASGSKDGVELGAGNSTIALETAMRNGKIPAWWASHLQNGEHTDLVVHATVSSETLNRSVEAPKFNESIDTDISSAFNSTETRPIEADQEPLVADPVLYVNETRGWWGSVTREETTIRMRFEVYNPKPYPVPIQEVSYDVGMNGIDVGSGATDRSYTVPPGETRTIAAELTLRNDRFDEWWVSHLERNQRTDLTVGLSLVVDLSNAGVGGPTVTVPVDTIEHTFETDVFGNKDQYPTGDAGSENGDDAGNGSDDTEGTTRTATSESEGSAAETPTATSPPASTPSPTPTPSPTATPTDDGLVGADPLNESAP